MFTPQARRSARTLLRLYGEPLIARLTADPETRHLASAFECAQGDLEHAAIRTKGEAGRLRQAVVIRNRADEALASAVFRFENAVQVHVELNRRCAQYRRYFPGGRTAHSKITPSRRVAKASLIELQLVRDGQAGALRRFLPLLSQSRSRLEKAIVAVRKARTVAAEARSAGEVTRSEWVAAYRVVYARLIVLLQRDRRRVDGYFTQGPTAKPRRSP